MPYLWNLQHLTPETRSVLDGETIPAMFWSAVAQRADSVWLRHKELGIWRSHSWREVGEAVKDIAGGLLSLGLAPGETVSILSNTVVEWVFADLAVLSCGAVSNGIYPTDAPSQVQYLCQDSATCVLMVENDEQLDKALAVRAQLPLLRKLVVFDMKGLRQLQDPDIISLSDLRALGRQYNRAYPQQVVARAAAVRPQDLAILVYTSGTTGKPKGAMHSQRGLVHTVRGYNTILPRNAQDECMCFLPLCHIAERVGGEYFSLYTGARLNFVESPETVPENIREIAPTVCTAVPRVWEKFYSGVTLALADATALQRACYAWALGVGSKVAQAALAGQPIGLGLRAAFVLAHWTVLGNVRKSIGIDRARYLVTGAAPISPDLVRWYLALGVPMLEVWGMTETCGASSCMPPGAIVPGSIGVAASFNEVRIDPHSSEIQVRGGNVFMGYLNLPDKTAESFAPDGWLRTGDGGNIDGQGYLRITDRMKDIVITAGGKNVAPSEWENQLKLSPYITDAVIIGDQRPYLSAILMIDQDNVEQFAQARDVPFSDYASLARAQAVLALIEAEIERVNQQFARVEQVKRFYLLETQLTPEDEELTPTMKLKRQLVQSKYAAQIAAMYA